MFLVMNLGPKSFLNIAIIPLLPASVKPSKSEAFFSYGKDIDNDPICPLT